MARSESTDRLDFGERRSNTKSCQKLVAPVAGMFAAACLTAIGVGGVAAQTSPETLPNLFIGITGAGIIIFLLMIPIFNKRMAKAKKKKGEKLPAVNERKVWALAAEQVCADLNVSDRVGLSDAEAEVRYSKYGANEAFVRSDPGYWSFFVKELYEPTQLLLLCVGLLYLMFGSLEEAITAFVVIILMASAEVSTEWRAKRALSNLQYSSPPAATVKREGQSQTLDARLLVPGDIVILKVGMEVPADLRLIRSYFLHLDESKLTGESTPVPKDPSRLLPEETFLLDRTNVALAGSLVRRGRGVGVVYQTGTSTYLGQVVDLSQKTKEKKTKLQTLMKEMAYRLTLLALFMSLVGALLELWKGTRWQDVVTSGLSLAFATIPEELPILIAAVLAVGAQALSKRFMYVKKLRAAENLGFVDTILTDKTGTLTENCLLWHSAHLGTEKYEIRSRVLSFRRDSDNAGLEELLEAWLFMSDIGDDLEDIAFASDELPVNEALSDDVRLIVNSKSDAKDSDNEAADSSPHNADADVFDRAVLFALGSTVCFLGGPSGHGLLASNPNIKYHLERVYKTKTAAEFVEETPFDPAFKYSSRTFQISPELLKSRTLQEFPDPSTEMQVMYMKGAPELLLKHCSSAMENGSVVPISNVQGQIEEQVVKAAAQGHRLIGYAHKYLNSSGSDPTCNSREASLPISALEGAIFLGFFSFLDTVRSEAAASVSECQDAGIRVIMVTGDHAETAIAVAQQVGIISAERDLDLSGIAVSCTDIQLSNMLKGEQEDFVMRKSVFARATPADKLIILEALQSHGKCVMATGDGVNDAPILAQADVGVAMGKGTDVAREAAAVVLMDDNFRMIPISLAEGRRLLDNLRKALTFYLGAKVGLIVLFILGTLWDRGPLSAIQIILLELFMDFGASTSFLMEPADTDIMKRKPRDPAHSFFDSELMTGIVVSATTMCITVLPSFVLAVHHDPRTAQTSAFLTWLYAQVLMAFNLRTFRQPVILKGLFSNVGMLLWLLLTILLSIVIGMSHFVRKNLGLVRLSRLHWFVIILMAIVSTCWIEVVKLIVSVFHTRKVVFRRSWHSTKTNSRETLQIEDERVPLTQTA